MAISTLRTYRASFTVRTTSADCQSWTHELDIYYKATTPNAAAVDFWRWWNGEGKKVAAAAARKHPSSHRFVSQNLVRFRIYLFKADKISGLGKLPTQPTDYLYAWSEGMDPPKRALARSSGSGRARPAGTVRAIPLTLGSEG